MQELKALVSTLSLKEKMFGFLKLKPGEDLVAWSLCPSLKAMSSSGKCEQMEGKAKEKKGDWEEIHAQSFKWSHCCLTHSKNLEEKI